MFPAQQQQPTPNMQEVQPNQHTTLAVISTLAGPPKGMEITDMQGIVTATATASIGTQEKHLPSILADLRTEALNKLVAEATLRGANSLLGVG